MRAGCSRGNVRAGETRLVVRLTVPLGEAVREGKWVILKLRDPPVARDRPRPRRRIREWPHDWDTGVGIAARVGVG